MRLSKILGKIRRMSHSPDGQAPGVDSQSEARREEPSSHAPEVEEQTSPQPMDTSVGEAGPEAVREEFHFEVPAAPAEAATDREEARDSPGNGLAESEAAPTLVPSEDLARHWSRDEEPSSVEPGSQPGVSPSLEVGEVAPESRRPPAEPGVDRVGPAGQQAEPLSEVPSSRPSGGNGHGTDPDLASLLEAVTEATAPYRGHGSLEPSLPEEPREWRDEGQGHNGAGSGGTSGAELLDQVLKLGSDDDSVNEETESP